ncbi:MAG: class I SAM-dependent methyltransferase [Ruminococcus sp.]|nr:class I SAM-dependent methyltransferase [Ruminococcus sp.]
MIWDKFSAFYDRAETLFNREVFLNTGKVCAEYIESSDRVLECACGTGAISVWIAPACRELTVTDLSHKMLAQADKKLARFDNVRIRHADIFRLRCPDGSFDKVIAGNVIHLLDEPGKALEELLRVCRPGGLVILPTYLIGNDSLNRAVVAGIDKAGVNFRHRFELGTYRSFLEELGHPAREIKVVKGRMPCAVAVIEKKGEQE